MRGAVRLRIQVLARDGRPRGLRHLPPHNRKRWDSSADTSAPLASRLAGSKSLASCLPRDIGFSIGHLSKPSSYRMRLVELSSQRRRPVNEAVPTRTTPDTNQSAPGAGTPTGDFWKRSGQHEPRRVPGHGAPLIEVVFQKAQARQRSRPLSRQPSPSPPIRRRTPPPAAAAPAHPGSSAPPTARNRATAHP